MSAEPGEIESNRISSLLVDPIYFSARIPPKVNPGDYGIMREGGIDDRNIDPRPVHIIYELLASFNCLEH